MNKWLRHLWTNEDGFFGIGIGPSSAETAQAGQLGSLANFGTSEGESDIMAGDNFWKSILTGDPGQISKVLGPALSGINKRGQESKKTNSEFGNRSGGTNAKNQSTDDTTRAGVDSLVSGLTAQAPGALAATGSSLFGTGAAAHEGAFSADQQLQQQKAAKWNDIFKSIASVAAAPFTGEGKFIKPRGGGGNTQTSTGPGNWWDNYSFPGGGGGNGSGGGVGGGLSDIDF